MKRPPAQIPTLVTGCSSGIGQATALRLVAAGFPVLATARDVSTLTALADAGCQVAALDVTDLEAIDRVVSGMEDEFGAVGALVNNAGYSQSGAIESVTDAQARRQMDTNVFGPMALVRRVLPGMRRAGWGRIVQISSMGGRFTFPGGGWYHASKHALEALSDALRFEVKGFGIDVVIVEPGIIVTGFAAAATNTMADPSPGAPSPDDDPYAAFDAHVAKVTTRSYESETMTRLGGTPDDVAKAIEKALRAGRPRTRMLVTPSARLSVAAHAVLTDRGWDRFAGRTFIEPKDER